MAWHFVRLKYRVTGRVLGAGSAWTTLGVIVLWLSALGVGVAGGALVAAGVQLVERNYVPAILVGVAVQVAWVIVPIVTFALDASVNPRWFELLPIAPGDLSRGLLAAGMVGPGGLATFLFTTIGFGFGYWPGWWGVITVPLIGLAMTFLGVVTGRLVTTVLSELLTRVDLAALGPILGLGLAGVSIWLSGGSLTQGSGGVSLPEWLEVLAVVPGGALGGFAAGLADEGRWWVVALTGAWIIVTGAVLVWGHTRALERLQTEPVTTRAVRTRAKGTRLMGEALARWVPATAVRVAAAKEARYLRRDPRLRAQLVGGVVTVAMFGFFGASLLPARFAPLLAVLVTWAAVSTLAPNQFGVDGGSVWAYVVSPTNMATVLAGKNVAWAMVVAPVAVVAGVTGSVIAGSARLLVAALLLSLAVGLIWMAVGNITSIYGAFRYPERNAFSSGPQSGRAIGASLLGLTVSGALTMPMVLYAALAYYFGEAPALTLVAAGSVVYGLVLFRAGFQWAQTAVVQRQFDLMEVLDKA